MYKPRFYIVHFGSLIGLQRNRFQPIWEYERISRAKVKVKRGKYPKLNQNSKTTKGYSEFRLVFNSKNTEQSKHFRKREGNFFKIQLKIARYLQIKHFEYSKWPSEFL